MMMDNDDCEFEKSGDYDQIYHLLDGRLTNSGT